MCLECIDLIPLISIRANTDIGIKPIPVNAESHIRPGQLGCDHTAADTASLEADSGGQQGAC